jgi:hypothetical protein
LDRDCLLLVGVSTGPKIPDADFCVTAAVAARITTAVQKSATWFAPLAFINYL